MSNPAVADHTKIITRAAKDVLLPLGCKQKGRSLLWFADHGWWLALVEFPESPFTKGSHINVGAMWLWSGQKTLTFHDGYRIESFQEFRMDYQLLIAAQKLAISAGLQLEAYRKRFASIQKAAIYLTHKKKKTEWDLFHAAASAALIGKDAYAQSQLDELAAMPGRAPWQVSIHAKAAKLTEALSSGESAQQMIREDVAQTRSLLKLPALPFEDLWT